jgi:hypothetical protein
MGSCGGGLGCSGSLRGFASESEISLGAISHSDRFWLCLCVCVLMVRCPLIEREREGDAVGDGSFGEVIRVINVDGDEMVWVVASDVIKDLLCEGFVSFVVGDVEHLVIRMLFAVGIGLNGFDDDDALFFWHRYFLSSGVTIVSSIA